MKNLRRGRRRDCGYTLIEVLVASAILLIGISAASSLSLTMTTQEEINHRVARSLNVLENYARLYQLGLDPADIDMLSGTGLMPVDPAVSAVAFAASDWSSANIALESYTFTMTINSVSDAGDWSEGKWTGGSQATVDQRQAVVRAFRPTTR